MKKFMIRISRIFRVALMVALCAGLGIADSPPVKLEPDVVVPPTSDTSENTGPTTPSRVLPGEKAIHKSYIIPAIEIPIFIVLLNRFDYYFVDPRSDYDVSMDSIRDHLEHGPWVVDQDVFTINQLGHPYQGSMYYGFARSANLNFWESMLYANAGSAIWEIAGETTPPSINDQVASGVGGSFLGEVLYRLSNLVLETGGERPGVWRHIGAAVISPPTELNRLIFGDRFGPVFEGRNPALFSRLDLGAGSNENLETSGSTAQLGRKTGYGNFEISYGLPGKPGYRYQRPLDYFNLEIHSIVEKGDIYASGMMRGLLFGFPYEAGETYRGIWGLYGSFDYLSPQVYRVSTTGANLGTTGQWWLSKHIALQGSVLAGVGYGAAGTIQPDNPTEPDYHYGMTPQQLLNLRLILGKRVMIDATGRNYYITHLGASKARGTESIQQANASLTLRLFGHQAISLGYLLGRRDARYESGALPDRKQRVDTVMLTYTLLGQPHFRAVGWGDHGKE
jgi:hypothetical protein